MASKSGSVSNKVTLAAGNLVCSGVKVVLINVST